MPRPRYTLGGKPKYRLGGYATPKGPTPAEKTWTVPNAQGVTGQQALLAAWAAKQPQDGGDAAAPEDTTPFAGDSTYFAEMARRQFDVDQKKAEFAQQSAYDRQDLAEALRRMALKQTEDRQSTKESANSQGLYFSGHLGKSLGDLDTAYARQQGDSQQSFDRREAARKAASAALDQGYTLDQASALAAAADRKIATDQEAAAGGYLAPDPARASAPAATGTAPAVARKKAVTTTGFNQRRQQRFRVVNRGGKIFHTYAGGRPVRVG